VTESYLKQDGLAHLAIEGRATESRGEAGVAMAQRPYPAIFNLRGNPSDQSFMQAAAQVLGAALPVKANSSLAVGDAEILWLGPDEWWIVSRTDPSEAEAFAQRLRDAVKDVHAAVTEVGDSRVCLRISGPKARDLLSKGTSLDLHPSVFGGLGRCAQTHLAKTIVVMHQTADDPSDGPTFEIFVLRSFADYLWRWLEDAAQEFGVAIL